MADFSSYDTTNSPTGPEKPRVFGLKVINDIDLLRRNGLGDTITKVAGYLQAYDRGSGKIAFRVVRNDGPTYTLVEALAGEYFLVETLDCNSKILKNPKLDPVATGSLLALHNDNEGVLQEDTTLKRTAKGGAAAGRRVYLGQYDIDGGHYRRMHLPMLAGDFSGTTTKYDGVTGFVFDDGTDEWVFISDMMPYDYTAGHDVVLELLVRINQAETSTDTIDFKLNYESRAVGTETFGGTETAITTVDQGTLGASGTASGTLHHVRLSLPYDDATNPIAAGDALRVELLRNGLATVGSVAVLRADLLIPVYGGVDRQL